MSCRLLRSSVIIVNSAQPAIEKLGNPGWNWETYPRYLKKSERYVRRLEQIGYWVLTILYTKFTPPDASEAEAEHLHYELTHHGIDGERRGRVRDPGSG